jgi:hypothetical protein
LDDRFAAYFAQRLRDSPAVDTLRAVRADQRADHFDGGQMSARGAASCQGASPT